MTHVADVAIAAEDIETAPTPPPFGTAMTVRALVLSVILSVILSYWIAQAEVIVRFCNLTESVPTIPAVAVLMFLAVVNPLVRRLSRRWSLDRREVLLIYVFLTVAASMAGCGIMRFFVNLIPALFYFATPANDFAQYQQYIPLWAAPHDAEAIRAFYEGSETGAIMWRPWLAPLAMWGLLFTALWITMMCAIVAFRRQWSEKEKLTFPLLHLPLEVSKGVDGNALVVGFFRNPVMWVGFGAAFVYNLTNIINAYDPSFACLGKYYDIGALFTERPLNALRPMSLHYRPEMIGLGYLVSTEVAFSVWVLYLLLKVERLVAFMLGHENANLPFAQEQGLGAYVAVALLLFWVGRHHLADVARKAISGDRTIHDADEPMSYRLAAIGVIGGFAACLLWCHAAGMALWLAGLYFGLVIAVALVYARIRAEVGVPLIWMFPYYQTYKGIKYTFGSQRLYIGNSWSSLTIFSTLVFLSRGYFPALIGYQIEGFEIARRTDIRQRHMSTVLLIAVIVGFYIAVWTLLRSYYEFGAGGLRSLSGWGSGIARQEYTALVSYATTPVGPDVQRMASTAIGFLMAAGLMGARMVFLRSPLHPLAFCMVTSYGELIWGTFLIVWLVKSTVAKLGGMRLYRRLIPGFLGLALGHFFTAGVLYGLIGTFGGEQARRYGVWFG